MTPAAPDGSKLGARRRLLLRFERFSRRHYTTVFLAALLCALAGGWLGSRLSLESDILSLIPAGNPQVDGFKRATSDFGSVSYLLLLLEAEDGAGADELEDFADKFAGRMERLEDLHGFRVESVAHAGDLIEDMAYNPAQGAKLLRTLTRLRDDGKTPRAILISGGGNDMVGDGFGTVINHVDSGLPALNAQIVSGLVNERLLYAYGCVIGRIPSLSAPDTNRLRSVNMPEPSKKIMPAVVTRNTATNVSSDALIPGSRDRLTCSLVATNAATGIVGSASATGPASAIGRSGVPPCSQFIDDQCSGSASRCRPI